MLFTKFMSLIITASSQQVSFEPVHDHLQFDIPVQVLFDGVHQETMCIVEKKGLIRKVSMQRDADHANIYLDISDRVGVTYDEEGLLSAAFHPDFKNNGKLYVWYSAQHPKRGVLSVFVTDDVDGKTMDPKSEQILLEVEEPWPNHNGGTILFGPDGYLYLSIGDGGSANDPNRNGQNRKSLLASIIRIDVDTQSKGRPYSIPKDNPFVGDEDARGEIWAFGLRNVWRMSFDRATGTLWAGDVGQNLWEEIDKITKGGNYGWSVREGRHPFQSRKAKPDMIDPVFDYDRATGRSITGGYVYRGKQIPELVGGYVYADYISERTWVLFPSKEDKEVYASTRIADTTPLAISSFGETPDGELLACGFDNPYASSGKIYILTPLQISSKPKDIQQ